VISGMNRANSNPQGNTTMADRSNTKKFLGGLSMDMREEKLIALTLRPGRISLPPLAPLLSPDAWISF
jgi:hypothetical protein